MLRIGPFDLQPWHLLLLAIGLLVLGWFLWSFIIPVTGTWERVDEDAPPGKVERITLVQFGPFVRGRRIMRGGFQEFRGILRGRNIFLGRIDHGKAMLIAQGFPEAIAEEIDGTQTARMRLILSQDSSAIFGTFTPQKIEFTHRPPKIVARFYLQPSFRRYKLISRNIHETELVESGDTSTDEKQELPLRRTV